MVRKIFTAGFLCLFLMTGLANATPPLNFRDLYKNAGPAVVNINTEKLVEMRRSPFPSPFDDFFRNGPGFNPFDPFSSPRGEQPKSRQRSLGSGFIVSEDGYIVTNHHVVEGADKVKVTLSQTEGSDISYEAEVIGGDKDTDLAVLKISTDKSLPFLTFGDSADMEVGDWVLAIGNPFGLDHTATAGIISAKGRNIRSGPFDSFIQTDASINPGNSGGPLLNMAGEVIGINTAIIAGGQGIGFAIPSNMAKDIITALRDDRRVSRGWLGVHIQSVDEPMAKALGLEEAKGAFIADVVPDNPAAKAGMEPGDVVIAVNGKAIADSDELLRRIASLKPGEKVTLTVWRDGKKKELTAELTERGADQAANGKGDSGKSATVSESLGLTIRPLTSQDAARYRLDSVTGLLITAVDASKAAGEAGIQPGDVILAVNGTQVNSVADFSSILEKQGKKRGAVMLHLVRQGQKFFRTLEIK
ncbi:DegQ family serine endoprotease [Desulfovibrio sp. OttesenSCG-928-I05]|nr:DegQ family serine endoprotease [Desulfovibrio sp. OttesenSCG-928-I05]